MLYQKIQTELTSPQPKTKGGEDMKEMTELKMVYELVISRANPLDNPRYELLNQAQRKMKDKILNVISFISSPPFVLGCGDVNSV